jgi:hypothetical protein
LQELDRKKRISAGRLVHYWVVGSQQMLTVAQVVIDANG